MERVVRVSVRVVRRRRSSLYESEKVARDVCGCCERIVERAERVSIGRDEDN